MYKFVCAHLPRSRCVTNKCKKISEKTKFQSSDAHASTKALVHDCCEDAEENNENENSSENHQLACPDKVRRLIFSTNLLKIKGNKLIPNSKLREPHHTFYASLVVNPPVPSISKKYFHVYSISWLPKRFYTPCYINMTNEEIENYKKAMEQIESIQKQRTGLSKLKSFSAHKVNSSFDTWLKKRKRQTSKTEITYPTHTIKHNLTLNRRYRIREGSNESKLKFFENEFVKRKRIQALAMKPPRYKPIVYPKHNTEVKNKSVTNESTRDDRSKKLEDRSEELKDRSEELEDRSEKLEVRESITKYTEDTKNSIGEISIKSHPTIENASNEIKMKLKTKYVQLLLKPVQKLNVKNNTEDMETDNDDNKISDYKNKSNKGTDEIEQTTNQLQEEKIQSHPASLPAKMDEANAVMHPKRIYVDTSNVYEIDKVCVVEKSRNNNQGDSSYNFDQSDVKKDLPPFNLVDRDIPTDYTIGKVNKSCEQLEKEIEKLSQIITRLQDLERKIELSSRKLDKQQAYEETISKKIDELSKQRDMIMQELKQISSPDRHAYECKSNQSDRKERTKSSMESTKISTTANKEKLPEQTVLVNKSDRKGRTKSTMESTKINTTANKEPTVHVVKHSQNNNQNSMNKDKENIEKKMSSQNDKVADANKTLKSLDDPNESVTKNYSKQLTNFNSKHNVKRCDKHVFENHKKSIIELNETASQHKSKQILIRPPFQASFKEPQNENEYKKRMEEESDHFKIKNQPFHKTESKLLEPNRKTEINSVKENITNTAASQNEQKIINSNGGLDILPSKSEPNIMSHPTRMREHIKSNKDAKESESHYQTMEKEDTLQDDSIVKRSISFNVDSYQDTIASSFAQIYVKKYWFQNQSLNKDALNMEIEQNGFINALKKTLNAKREYSKSTLGNSGDNKSAAINDGNDGNYLKRTPIDHKLMNNGLNIETQKLKKIHSGAAKINDGKNTVKIKTQEIVPSKADNNVHNQQNLNDSEIITAKNNQNIFISMINDVMTKQGNNTDLKGTSVNTNQKVLTSNVDNATTKGKPQNDSNMARAPTDLKNTCGQSSGDKDSQKKFPEIKCIVQYNPTNDQLTLNIPDAGKSLPLKKLHHYDDKTKQQSSNSNSPVLKDVTIKDINDAILKEFFTEKLLPGTVESIYLPKHQLVVYDREYSEESTNKTDSAEMDRSSKRSNLQNLSGQKKDNDKEKVCSVKSAVNSDLQNENKYNSPKEDNFESKRDKVLNSEVKHQHNLKLNCNLVTESVKNAAVVHEKGKDSDDDLDMAVHRKMETTNFTAPNEEIMSSEISKQGVDPLNFATQVGKKQIPKTIIQPDYPKKTRKIETKGQMNANLEKQEVQESKTDINLENKIKDSPVQASSVSLTFVHNKEINSEKKECKGKIGVLKINVKKPNFKESTVIIDKAPNTKPVHANDAVENKPEINFVNKIRVSPPQGPPNASLKYTYQTGNDLRQKEVIRPETVDSNNKQTGDAKESIIFNKNRQSSGLEAQKLKENNSDINLGNKIRAPPPQPPPRSDKEKKEKPKGKKDIVLPPKIRNLDTQLPENLSKGQSNQNVARNVQQIEKNLEAKKEHANEVLMPNTISKTKSEHQTRKQGIPKIVKMNRMSPSSNQLNSAKTSPIGQQKPDNSKIANMNISEQKDKDNKGLNSQKTAINTADIKTNYINQKGITKKPNSLSADRVEKLNVQSRSLFKESLKGNHSVVKLNQKEEKENKPTNKIDNNSKKENIKKPFTAFTKKEFAEKTSNEVKVDNTHEDKVKGRPTSSPLVKSGTPQWTSSNSRNSKEEKETKNKEPLRDMKNSIKVGDKNQNSPRIVKVNLPTFKDNFDERTDRNVKDPEKVNCENKQSNDKGSKSVLDPKNKEPVRDMKNSIKVADKYQNSPRIINVKDPEKVNCENKQSNDKGSTSVLDPKKMEAGQVRKEPKKVSTAEKTGRPTSCPPMKPQAANYCSGVTKRTDYLNSKKKAEQTNNKVTKQQRTNDKSKPKEENPTVVTFTLPHLEDYENQEITKINDSKNVKGIEKQTSKKDTLASSGYETKDFKENQNTKEFPKQNPQQSKSVVKFTLPSLDPYFDTKPELKVKSESITNATVHEKPLLSQKKLLEDQNEKSIPTVKMSTISYATLDDKYISNRASIAFGKKKRRTFTTTKTAINRSNSAIFKIFPESEIMILKKAEYSSTKGRKGIPSNKEEENQKENKVKRGSERSKIVVEMSSDKQEGLENPEKSQDKQIVENDKKPTHPKQEIGELLMQEVKKLFNRKTTSKDNTVQPKEPSLKSETTSNNQQSSNQQKTVNKLNSTDSTLEESKVQSGENVKLTKKNIEESMEDAKGPIVAQSAHSGKSYDELKKEIIANQKIPSKSKFDVAGEIGKQLANKTKYLQANETKMENINAYKTDRAQAVKNKIINNDSQARLRSDTLADNIKKVEDVKLTKKNIEESMEDVKGIVAQSAHNSKSYDELKKEIIANQKIPSKSKFDVAGEIGKQLANKTKYLQANETKMENINAYKTDRAQAVKNKIINNDSQARLRSDTLADNIKKVEDVKLTKKNIEESMEDVKGIVAQSAHNSKSYDELNKEIIANQKIPSKSKFDVAGEIGKQLANKTKYLQANETKMENINAHKTDRAQAVKNKIINNDSQARLRSDTLADNIKKVEDVLKQSGFLQADIKNKGKTETTPAKNDMKSNEKMNITASQNNINNQNNTKSASEIKELQRNELEKMKTRRQKEANKGKHKINAKTNQIEQLNSAARHILQQEEARRLEEMLKGNKRQNIYQKDAKITSPSFGKAILEQNPNTQDNAIKEYKKYDKEQLMSKAEYLEWRKTLKSKHSEHHIESEKATAPDVGDNYLNAKHVSLIIDNIKHKRSNEKTMQKNTSSIKKYIPEVKTLILNDSEITTKNLEVVKTMKLEPEKIYNTDLNRQKDKDHDNLMKNLSERDVNNKSKDVSIKDNQFPIEKNTSQPGVKYNIDLKCSKREDYNLTENDQSEKQRSTNTGQVNRVTPKASFSKLIPPLKKFSDEIKKDSEINDCGTMLEKPVSDDVKVVPKVNRLSKRKGRNPLTKYAHLRISYITMKRPANNSDNFLPTTTKEKKTETREISAENRKEIIKMRYEILRRLNEKFEKDNNNEGHINKNISTPEVVPYKFDNDDVKINNKTPNTEYRTKPGRIRKLAMKPRIRIGFQYSVYNKKKEAKLNKNENSLEPNIKKNTTGTKNNSGDTNDMGNRRKYSTIADNDNNKECEDACKTGDSCKDSNNCDQIANQCISENNNEPKEDTTKATECVDKEKDFDITEEVPRAFECASEQLEEKRQTDLYYRYHQLSFYDLHTHLRDWRTFAADNKKENQNTKNECNFDEVD